MNAACESVQFCKGGFIMENTQSDNERDQDLDEGLTELMKAHLDDVTGGAMARHNSWKQST